MLIYVLKIVFGDMLLIYKYFIFFKIVYIKINIYINSKCLFLVLIYKVEFNNSDKLADASSALIEEDDMLLEVVFSFLRRFKRFLW